MLESHGCCLVDCLSYCLSDYTPIKFSGPIMKTLAYNHTQDNHSDNISWIRTRAIKIVNVFEMEFRTEKDIWCNLKLSFVFSSRCTLVSIFKIRFEQFTLTDSLKYWIKKILDTYDLIISTIVKCTATLWGPAPRHHVPHHLPHYLPHHLLTSRPQAWESSTLHTDSDWHVID